MSSLKKVFGPSHDEVWRQLSEEIGGEFVPGGVVEPAKVKARVRDWTVTLDTYTVSHNNLTAMFTRIRAPYVNPDNFRFTIYRRSVFSNLGKFFGTQDIEIGDRDFDEAFIIKSNDEGKVRRLFQMAQLRKMVDSQTQIYLTVKEDKGWFGADFPEGVDELYFQVASVIRDVVRLKSLYLLFAQTLHSLCCIGSAYEEDPRVEL